MSAFDDRDGDEAAGARKPDAGSGAIAAGVMLDDFLPYLLNRISNRLNIELSEALRPLGVTQQDWRILAVLAAGDGRTISELVVYTVTPQSTLSRLIDRMERQGLVRKAGQDDDGRFVRVFITEEGWRKFEQVLPIAMRHYQDAVEGVGEEDLATTVRTLQRILKNIRRSHYA